jgi:hypothetical protein
MFVGGNSLRCPDWENMFTLPVVRERATYGSEDEFFRRRQMDGNSQEVEKTIANGIGNILT